MQCRKNGLLFYHLVGAGEQREEEIRGRVGDKIPQRVHRNESDTCTLAFYIT
jgi:hypothetical protein